MSHFTLTIRQTEPPDVTPAERERFIALAIEATAAPRRENNIVLATALQIEEYVISNRIVPLESLLEEIQSFPDAPQERNRKEDSPVCVSSENSFLLKSTKGVSGESQHGRKGGAQ